MANGIEESLDALGYAKVIAELKPEPGMATVAAAETAIESHFVIPSEAQTESLAATAMRHASRTFRRPQSLQDRKVRVYPRLGLAIGYVDRAGVGELKADNRVKDVVPAPELSLIKPVTALASRRKVERTWGLDALKVPELWAAGITGEGVVVGHLDTGIDGNHPAFKGAIAAFAEFDMAGDLVKGATPTDSGDHGTHTAGTIAGRQTSRGAFGVAPDAKLASAMVIEGGQVIDRILAGMEWIVEQNARVLSMSLGLRGFTSAFQVVIDALRRNDVLPVIAVGNEGPRTSRSPGNYDNVLSVGALDSTNVVADFSGSQSFDRPNDALVPDIVAPGVDVLSCVPGGGYAEMSGTSMATPHVAGLAALLFQAKPGSSAADVEKAILGSSRLLPPMRPERANRGLPDAVAAYTLLTGEPLPAPLRGVATPARRRRAARKAPARSRTAKRGKPEAAAKKRKKRRS